MQTNNENTLPIVAQNGRLNLDPVVHNLQNEFAGCIDVLPELVKLPRLKLDNPLSDAVKGGLSKPGEFSCFIRGINYGDTVTIVPLIISQSASYLDKDTSALICSSSDMMVNRNGQPCKQCPYGEYWNDWGNKDSPKTPKCKSSLDMVVMVNPLEAKTIMGFSFRKSNYKAGKSLFNLVLGDPRKIPFGRKYTITSKMENLKKGNKDYEYFVVHPHKIIAQALTDEELKMVIPVAREMLNLRNSGKIHHEVDNETDSELPENF